MAIFENLEERYSGMKGSEGGFDRREFRGLRKQARRGTLSGRERARYDYLKSIREDRNKRAAAIAAAAALAGVGIGAAGGGGGLKAGLGAIKGGVKKGVGKVVDKFGKDKVKKMAGRAALAAAARQLNKTRSSVDFNDAFDPNDISPVVTPDIYSGMGPELDQSNLLPVDPMVDYPQPFASDLAPQQVPSLSPGMIDNPVDQSLMGVPQDVLPVERSVAVEDLYDFNAPMDQIGMMQPGMIGGTALDQSLAIGEQAALGSSPDSAIDAYYDFDAPVSQAGMLPPSMIEGVTPGQSLAIGEQAMLASTPASAIDALYDFDVPMGQANGIQPGPISTGIDQQLMGSAQPLPSFEPTPAPYGLIPNVSPLSMQQVTPDMLQTPRPQIAGQPQQLPPDVPSTSPFMSDVTEEYDEVVRERNEREAFDPSSLTFDQILPREMSIPVGEANTYQELYDLVLEGQAGGDPEKAQQIVQNRYNMLEGTMLGEAEVSEDVVGQLMEIWKSRNPRATEQEIAAERARLEQLRDKNAATVRRGLDMDQARERVINQYTQQGITQDQYNPFEFAAGGKIDAVRNYMKKKYS